MPATTTRLGLPYPVPADGVDVPRDIQALANELAPDTVIFTQGTHAARPAAGMTGGGRFYFATDADDLYYDDGTTWTTITTDPLITVNYPVLDVGMTGQIRAGRQLTTADFTSMGLVEPVGLFNLSDLTNLGTGGALVNKGAVPFGAGINGDAATSAVFAGSTGQALYIADIGAGDPFRIRTGSWGCWFRTAKRGTTQEMFGKRSASTYLFMFYVGTNNVVTVGVSINGTTNTDTVGVSDVCDDRWHFTVGTFDGTKTSLYVDGVLEAVTSVSGAIGSVAAPLNIGAAAADSGTAAANPSYGRVDEAFVTHDILTEDQIRNLYCARLPHLLPATPSRVSLNVRRRRRGGPLAAADFPTQPVRLHNFTAGALTDQGTGNVALTNNGTAISVAGADGTPQGAFSFAGAQNLSASDAGLPAALTPRSYGCWLKTTNVTSLGAVMCWGTYGSADARIHIHNAPAGAIRCSSAADEFNGPFVADGQWHHVVVIEDNAAGDGMKRKLWVDGRLVGGSTVLNSITLAGANKFRVGILNDGGSSWPFIGQIDGVFVTADALTAAHVAALYAKGTEALAPSPKNAGDHVEALEAAAVLATFDSLETTALIDLGVTA